MEEAAVSQNCMGDIFSIDIATVVLSRRAVNILTEASCAAPGVHRSNPFNIRGQSASSPISSSSCGQLSLRPHFSACFSHASSAPGWADWMSRCRSRERFFDANTPSTADKRKVSGDPQARSTSPLRVLKCAVVSDVLRKEGESITAQRSDICTHGESCRSTGGVLVSGGVGAEGSVDNTLWSTQDVSCNQLSTICPPSPDASERYEARDRWRQSTASCRCASEREHPISSEPSVSSTAVSSPRRGNSQRSNRDASHVCTDRQEKQMQIRHRGGNDSAGSLQCHKIACGSQVVGSERAAPQNTYLYYPGEHEKEDSRKQSYCHQRLMEQVYNFLGAAFTATRSSLYVCVPVDATEDADSFGRTFTWPDSDTVGKEGNADTTFPAEDPAGSISPVTTAASSHAEYRGNFVSGYLAERKTITSTGASATAAKANAAACGAAADAAPDSAASVADSAAASFSCISPAVSSAVPHAAAGVNAVSSRASAIAPSESLRRDGRQIWSKRKKSPAALLCRSGLRCTYTQRDPRQPVVTPTCDVFRLIHHLYAFFARCAAAFTPFSADVYVVPVWTDPSVGDAGAAAASPAIFTPAGAGGGQPVTCETISAEAVTLPGASTWAKAGAATGSAAAGERGARDGMMPSSSAAAPDAQLATTLLAASGRAAEAADELDRDICGWQRRLLQALQSHCQSCRGIRVTGRQIVNVVDSNFELADRTFALLSSLAEGFATHSCALPINVLHACRVQPFAEVFSLLKIPAAPTTVSTEENTQRTEPSEIMKQPTEDFGAVICVERGDTKEAVPVDGAAACATETADDTEDALHEEARAVADSAVEVFGPGPVATVPAVADAAGSVIVKATDVASACAAGVATSMEAEGRAVVSGDTASDGTATTAERGTGLADQRRPLPAPAISQFPHVIVAGTFDRLHAGHKLLLTVAALLSSDSLRIGTTAGALIQKKVVGDAVDAAAAVQNFAARAHAVAAFVALIATAARAPSSPAAVTNQMRSVFSGVTSVANAARSEHAVSAAGHDAAIAAVAAAGDARLSETTFAGRQARASQGSSLVEEWRNIERGVCTIAEVKQETPRAAPAAATAFEGAAGRKIAFTTVKTAPTDEGGVEITTACRTASARPVRFVNYCQTVLHDEMFNHESVQGSSAVRCDCANRPAADMNAQSHTCTAGTQSKGLDKMTVGEATARKVEQQCFREEGKKLERRCAGGGIREDTRDSAEICASDAIGQEGRCQISRRHDDEEQAKTSAAKLRRDASDGFKEQSSRRESESAKDTSLMVSCKRPEGRRVTPGHYEELSDIQEQSTKQELEEESREKQWRELIRDAVAETESSAALSRTSQDSDGASRISSPSVVLARTNMYNVRSAESGWTSKDTRKPPRSVGEYVHSEGDHVFLPWVNCLLPPNSFFCGRSRAARRRLLVASDVSSRLRVREVANKGSGDSGLAVCICSCPASADAHPSFITTSGSVSASSPSVVSSTSSSAAYFNTTGSESFSGREASIVLPSSSLPSFPAYTPETPTASPTATTLGVQRGISLARLSCSGATSERAAPNHPTYSLPSFSGKPLSVHLISLEDRLGPAGDLDFDALVVSSESLAGGFYVNEERIRRSHSPVCLVEVPALSASSEHVAHAQTALLLEEQDTLRRQTRSPTGKLACHVVAHSGSSVHFERAPLPLLNSNSVLPKQIPDAPECRDVMSRIGRSHAATYMYASAEPAYEQHLKSSSRLQGKLAEDHQISSLLSEMSNPRTTEETGVSKLNAVTPANTIHGRRGGGLCTEREKRFTEEFCECDTGSDRGQEREAPASMACAATSAAVGSKNKQMKTYSLKTAPDMVEKLSSSQLRQQQATVLQSCVDIAFLRRRFADAAGVLFHAPAPVWRAYWSMLCSLYVAPWRRLFTFERLARLLSHLDTLKERISELKCFDAACDAIVILSLCFTYALHRPPGLYHCRPPISCAAVAASSTSTPNSGYLDKTPTWCSGSSQADRSNQTHFLKPCFECGGVKAHVIGAGDIPGSGDSSASASAKEPAVEEDELVVNEQLMHGFMWDASVCSRLRLYCRSGRFAEQSPVSGTARERNVIVCDHAAAVLREASQMNIDPARRVEGDLESAELLALRAANLKILHILISCMRTARESCGFLLPRRSSSVTWHSQMSAPACNYFRNKEELSLEPRRSDRTTKSCLPRHTGDRLHLEAKPFDGTMAARLQQLESQCCHVVRMLELLELAAPGVIYDLCARRMREEYYHMCDCHYACHRKAQLQSLQRQLFGGADGLTEVDVCLVRQNLAREQLALDVDDRLQGMKKTSRFACACGR